LYENTHYVKIHSKKYESIKYVKIRSKSKKTCIMWKYTVCET